MAFKLTYEGDILRATLSGRLTGDDLVELATAEADAMKWLRT